MFQYMMEFIFYIKISLRLRLVLLVGSKVLWNCEELLWKIEKNCCAKLKKKSKNE